MEPSVGFQELSIYVFIAILGFLLLFVIFVIIFFTKVNCINGNNILLGLESFLCDLLLSCITHVIAISFVF